MSRSADSRKRLDAFNLEEGEILADKYEVVQCLGKGWEGEVYLVRERGTGIERSVKLFFPARNPGNRAVRFYAKKLHKLRHCPILIQYHTQDRIRVQDVPVTLLVSDYVEGEILSGFVKRQPGGRLDYFQGLHLLHTLASGIEDIHNEGEYHGDLHDENIIIQRRGLGFEVKLLDMYHWGRPSAANIRHDVHSLVRLLYDVIGGQTRYRNHPDEVKAICCGLQRRLIFAKFRTAGQLRQYLESLDWQTR